MSVEMAGIKIGHATDVDFHTGCTVFLCPPGTVGSVDVRGPAPGSREAALMGLDKPISIINAIVLTGGSAFGLATSDGVMRYLAEQGIGHWTPIRPIPIVPAAVVYDLFLNGGRRLPDAEMGYAACLAATVDGVAQGNVGAGAGVTVGKWSGFEGMMKGGFGLAGYREGDLIVGAAAVVNAVGDVVNPDGSVLAGARAADGRWQVSLDRWRRLPERPAAVLADGGAGGGAMVSGTNTTLIVVATNARFDKVLANRLAQRAHDGLAIAVRPAHTSHDGDTAFALATGEVTAPFDDVANIATEMVAEAIRNAVRHAEAVVTEAGRIPGLAGPGV